jgi:VanZ family protein
VSTIPRFADLAPALPEVREVPAKKYLGMSKVQDVKLNQLNWHGKRNAGDHRLFMRGSAVLRGSARALAWCLLGMLVIVSLVPPALRPETGAPHNLEHFVPYLLTGIAFSIGYPGRISLLTVSLVTYCGFVELAQLMVPGRHARLSDFFVDAVAIVAGITIGSAARLCTKCAAAKMAPSAQSGGSSGAAT